MKAIVITTDKSEQLSLLNERYPSCLFPVLDRPLLQHIIEFLVEKKILEFEFVLNHLPEKIETLLGDGTRWGAKFTFHLVKNTEDSYQILKRQSQQIVLASANSLPVVEIPEKLSQSAVFVDKDQKWCGWGLFTQDTLKELQDTTNIYDKLLEYTKNDKMRQNVETLIQTSSYQELLQANQQALQKKIILMSSSREAEEGIWISRNVSLHPTARLEAPVYIGENCRISAGAKIGPNVVIGEGCILESQSHAQDTVIFPKSYVGEALELNNVIVDKNCLINVEIGAALEITDNFILGNIADQSIQQMVVAFISKAIGVFALVLFSPITLLTVLLLKLFRRGSLCYKKHMVKLPATVSEAQWESFELCSFCNHEAKTLSTYQHFLLCFLPALPNIIKGNLGFVGVPPRSKEEILKLPSDWRSLYLNTKSGIISEYFVYKKNISEEDFYAADAFYAVSKSFKHDCMLVVRYFGNLLMGK